MKFKPRHTFFILTLFFLIYSLSIYLRPLSVIHNKGYNIDVAARGRLVWQNNNCQSCHQLYGLGGYLGPDLTNVISHPKKGEVLLRALVKTGTKQMPAFTLTENEMQELIEFLKATDASGVADPRAFSRNNYGMIEAYERK